MTVRLGTDTAWAIFSECMAYRYALGREWPALLHTGEPRFLVWALLNPSTADHLELDPTLRRCEGFSRAWGYTGMYILNAYAFRATDPRELPRSRSIGSRAQGPISHKAIGVDNDEAIRFWSHQRDVVVGWGKHCHLDRASFMYRALSSFGTRIDCLGTNDDGSPKHPLYIAASTPRQPWSPP